MPAAPFAPPPPPPEPPFKALTVPEVPPLPAPPPPVDVIVLNAELDPVVPRVLSLAAPEPPAPTVTVYAVPVSKLKEVSADAPPPLDPFPPGSVPGLGQALGQRPAAGPSPATQKQTTQDLKKSGFDDTKQSSGAAYSGAGLFESLESFLRNKFIKG